MSRNVIGRVAEDAGTWPAAGAAATVMADTNAASAYRTVARVT